MLHWIAELTQPLRELLCSKNAWVWNPPSHESAFHKVKSEITKPAILCHYNPAADTKISADASSYGLANFLAKASKSAETSSTQNG